MTLNDNVPRFNDGKHSLGQALCCPSCGSEFIHQTGVDVYKRHTEDAERGLSVRVNDDTTMNVSERTDEESGNPSPRRDGLRIRFACEQCSGLEDVAELVIVQHKGNEFVRWDSV